MGAVSHNETNEETLAELLHELGDVPAGRVLRAPLPGAATEGDVDRLANHERQFSEMMDGVLVEKPAGHRESRLAQRLVVELGSYLRSHPRGILAGPDAPHRFRPGRIRMPDKVYTSDGVSETKCEDDDLNGADVLPGFRCSIREWMKCP